MSSRRRRLTSVLVAHKAGQSKTAISPRSFRECFTSANRLTVPNGRPFYDILHMCQVSLVIQLNPNYYTVFVTSIETFRVTKYTIFNIHRE